MAISRFAAPRRSVVLPASMRADAQGRRGDPAACS